MMIRSLLAAVCLCSFGGIFSQGNDRLLGEISGNPDSHAGFYRHLHSPEFYPDFEPAYKTGVLCTSRAVLDLFGV